MILLISSKNSYATKRLLEECRKQKIEIKNFDVQDLVDVGFKADASKYSCLYIRNPYLNGSPKYLPKIIKLAKNFEQSGKKVIDKIISKGKLGEGKWEDYKILKRNKIPIPKTCLLSNKSVPKKFPFILKWVFGFKGKNVFLIHKKQEFNQVLKKYSQDELLVQEFIEAKYEYKVITVGYKSLPVILRFNINPLNHYPDFRTAHVVQLTENLQKSQNPKQKTGVKDDPCHRVVKLAEKAAKVLGRELSKVDILEKDGKYYVLEVNRFPGFKSFEQLTKFNVAKEFLKYL